MSVAFKARIVVAEDEEFILNLLRARMDYNLEVQNLRKVAVPPVAYLSSKAYDT